MNEGEIEVTEVKEKLDRGDNFVLIDVREPHEYQICNIPARQTDSARRGAASAWTNSITSADIVIHCKSGMRSAQGLRHSEGGGLRARAQYEGRHSGLERSGRPQRSEVLDCGQHLRSAAERLHASSWLDKFAGESVAQPELAATQNSIPAAARKGPRPFSIQRARCERLKNSWKIQSWWRPSPRTTAAFHAVKGIDFEVRAGEVFGLLGPNGAGKTTTVEILEGLRSAQRRRRVACSGCDPEVQTRQLKDRIGVCLQATNLQDKITGRAKRWICSPAFYTRTVDGDQLLKRLQLWEKRDTLYAKLSGGQKQRLALALALLNDPQVLFLDEPSAGLDPQARLEIHELVQDLRREQRTILLTTHYIEEAEKLCDRVAIVDEGRIVAIGTPREIQETSAGALHHRDRAARTPLGDVATCRAWPDADEITLDDGARSIAVTTARPARIVVEMVKWLDAAGRRTGRHPDQAALAGRRLHRAHRKEPARMKAYLALFKSNMRLTLRDRGVLFFNYLFPLIFFFAFAELFHAGAGAGIAYFVSTVLVMGILGNGLWGAGMRSVQEREANILRRFKVTPISPLPILVAAMVSGWLLFLPVLVLLVGLAHFLYAMPLPAELVLAVR